jgi:phosphatidylcholine synthase
VLEVRVRSSLAFPPAHPFSSASPIEPQRIKAASVHVLTALGAVCGLLALLAAIARHDELAFLWLGIAFFIDGIDGYFARRFEVKSVLPNVSGETIDLCVDYVTYVFVPALLLLLSGQLPGIWGIVLAGLICVTSLYHFADEGSKSDDNCFVGFPAIWNIIAFYIFALAPPLWASSLLILACAGLTFVPWKWVHPMRVVELRGVTLGLTALWGIAGALVLWNGFPAGPLTAAILIGVAVYGVALSLKFGPAR